MSKKDRQLMLGIASEKFLDLCDKNNAVALYLDDQLSEEELSELFEESDLIYGLVALNWHILHGIIYEYSYSKFVEKAPLTQEEFDLCLEELQLLPLISEKSKEN